MIELTDEMLAAFEDAAWENPVEFGGVEMANNRAGLAAALAIVERDYDVRRRIQERPEMLSDRLGYPSSVGDEDWQRMQGGTP